MSDTTTNGTNTLEATIDDHLAAYLEPDGERRRQLIADASARIWFANLVWEMVFGGTSQAVGSLAAKFAAIRAMFCKLMYPR